MNYLEETKNILAKISNKCYEIISLPILKRLRNDNDYVIVDASRTLNLSVSEAKVLCQNIAKSAILESTTLIKETANFITATPEEVKYNFNKCPLITEVWKGDAYDKQGNDGLNMLYDELCSTYDVLKSDELFLKKCTEEILFEDLNHEELLDNNKGEVHDSEGEVDDE